MDYFFYNTDAKSLRGEGRFRILIEQGFAATSGPRSFGEQLETLSPGDNLLMYENGLGVVAVGTVLENWDGKTHKPPLYYRPGDDGFSHEYQIKVDWFLDLSQKPIALELLRQRFGSPHYTPRGAISPKIVKWRSQVQRMIDEQRTTTELAALTLPTNITRFFADILGAKLKNAVWSWGAADPLTNRVFLRVWQDQIETVENGERVSVGWDKPRRSSPGFPERQAHLAQINNGAEGFGVVCVAIDPNTKGARRIASFDHAILLRLGTFTKENGRTYAHIDTRVAVGEIVRQRTTQSTLPEDLSLIERQKIDSTTKEALICARVGQGQFRTQVLQIWESRCSVTGSVTKAAIRASHIKPWRESTNEERLDPHNGLPLVASLDALFDAGLISFESSGALIVSPEVTPTERQIFGIGEQSLTKKPSAKTAEYLTHHRRKHGFKE
jgi:putative restriction endonuclease